jgi:hypothetical protein
MDLSGEEWRRTGATLSDKTARSEFGLTHKEIIAGIRAGKLQYRLQGRCPLAVPCQNPQ